MGDIVTTTDSSLQTPQGTAQAVVSEHHSLVPRQVTLFWQWVRRGSGRVVTQSRLLLVMEILGVILWALLVTRPYLTLDPLVIPEAKPDANEYLTLIASNHFWTRFQACGLCSLWDGSMLGGAPAMSNPYTSMLHPLMMVPNLLWGVRNGTMLAVVASFALAGVAQWWLAYELGVGRLARLWSALMVVVAGHLSSRMEPGFYGLVLSSGACALILPPLIVLRRNASRRMAVVLGVVLALAAVSGQGYLQLGFLLTLPALVFLLPWMDAARLHLLLRRYAFAAVVALLLAAPFVLPVLHFLPEFTKLSDPEFKSAQPFTYTLFNLVLHDPAFYYTEYLDKLSYPSLYGIFVGWVPLLLALWGLFQARGALRRVSLFLATITLIPLWAASDGLLPAIAGFSSEKIAEFLAGLRFYPVIAGLAIPPLLALAAMGLDALLRNYAARINRTPARADGWSLIGLDLRWLLVPLLLWSLLSAWTFSSNWIATGRIDEDIFPVLEALQTPDLQWVNPPGATDHRSPYVEPGIAMGLKLAHPYRSFVWKDRDYPMPVLGTYEKELKIDAMIPRTEVGAETIYAAPPGWEYAAISHADGSRTVCTAQGTGGDIIVTCESDQPGVLVVKENNWSGWKVKIDGEPSVVQPLRKDTQWLRVELPAGQHTVEFRYRPLDVLLGFVLAGGGLALAIYGWFKS
jgi:hypothetical protein